MRAWCASALLVLLCATAAGAAEPPVSEATAEALAGRIRQSSAIDAPEARRAALRRVADEATRAAATVERSSGLWRRLQSDRLLALSLAGAHADAAATHDALRAAGHPIRPYLLPAAAESLFAVGRDAEGEQLLLAAIDASPADPQPLRRLGELLAERGRLATARLRLQQWLEARGAAADARARLAVGLQLARYERWAEDFDAATARLEALASDYPGEAEVTAERAALERQRGRPRLALRRLGGETGADAREIAAQAWLDLGRTDRAAAQLASPPADVARRLARQRGSRGVVAAGYASSRSAAITSPNGAEEHSARLRADSARLADHWRVGGTLALARAEFQNRRPEALYAGARVTHHGSGGETSLEAGRTFDDFLERSYVVLDSAYWLSDEWRLAARLALEDPEGPLQARASGIGIDSAQVAGTWRPQPEVRIDASAGGARFDDRNDRRWLSLSGEQRLQALRDTSTSVFASGYLVRNELDAAPYFNPSAAQSLELGLVHRAAGPFGTEQRLRPSVAAFFQRGYDAAIIPLFGYALRLPVGVGAFEWELGFSRPVYDGARETRWSLGLSYAWGAG